MLETNPVPAFWIGNAVRQIDPAFLRRFDLILEVGVPPLAARQRIMRRYVGDLPVAEAWLSRVAGQESLAPGHIRVAAKVATALGTLPEFPVTEVLERVLDLNLRLLGGQVPRSGIDAVRYDLEALNVDCDLEALVTGLRRQGRATLLLHGPPGSGKSAFVHHLSQRLERPLRLKKASDLLDRYLGGTEERIAEMFQQARQEGALLFLDEADSFLQERSRANQSWEVTQVNEFLVQMEQFEGLFLCATNFPEALDRASLRRFDLKIAFSSLRPEQSLRLFNQVAADLGSALATDHTALRRQLTAFTNLTPGDFATVVRRFRVLVKNPTQAGLLAALRQECEAKPDRPRPMGFAG
ncbi:MAG: ATP-binding protein [Magnetococcales bacterium]|nr:ATP-binding protein [Magnetococcales bacterium]